MDNGLITRNRKDRKQLRKQTPRRVSFLGHNDASPVRASDRLEHVERVLHQIENAVGDLGPERGHVPGGMGHGGGLIRRDEPFQRGGERVLVAHDPRRARNLRQ